MVVCVYVGHPHTGKPTHNLLDFGQTKAAGKLAEGALPTVQQHATPLETIDVDGRHITVLGRHGSPCTQEHHLQLFFSCLLACTALTILNVGAW